MTALKVGIDSYCFHRFFGEVYEGQPKPAQDMTMEDFLDFAVGTGVDGVSLESCFFPTMAPAWFEDLRRRLDDLHLERVYAWGHPQGLEDGSNREAWQDMVDQIPFAEMIGAAVMRVVPGPGSKDYRYEPRQGRLDTLASWFAEASAEAERRGVKLAAENHGDYTAAEMLWLVEAVGSDHFGVNFDTGNFVRLLDDPVKAMEKLSSHVYSTHIKDLDLRADASPADWFFFSSVAVGDGVVDIARIVQLLSEASYGGLLAVEIDHLHPRYGYDEAAVVERSLVQLRRLASQPARTERG